MATLKEGLTPTTYDGLDQAGYQVKSLQILPEAIECGAVHDYWEWQIAFPGTPPDMVLHVLVAGAEATRLLDTGRFVYRDTYESRGLPYTVIPCERFLLTLP